MSDDIELSPDKIAAALERLEAERAKRRAEGKPVEAAPMVIERVIVPDLDTSKFAPPPSPKAEEPRPRKAKKAPKASLTPTPFFTVLSNPVPGTDGAGVVSEAYFVTEGSRLALCGADGEPSGAWHPIHERGELYTARQALRNRLAASRGPGPNHERLVYPPTGWR